MIERRLMVGPPREYVHPHHPEPVRKESRVAVSWRTIGPFEYALGGIGSVRHVEGLRLWLVRIGGLQLHFVSLDGAVRMIERIAVADGLSVDSEPAFLCNA
jgi:hypothetical protein